jgi:hypothetical protein
LHEHGGIPITCQLEETNLMVDDQEGLQAD